ncbi:MAG: tetratricopeptide repeat protein [Bacteroidota bacterium]
MKTNLNKELFTETGCIDRRMLLNYRDGILKRGDMHLVERHLVDCALCSEALDGLSTLQDDSVLRELSQHFNPQTKASGNRSTPFRYLAMAASLTAVIALSYFAIPQSKNATVQEQALNSSPSQLDEIDSTAQSNALHEQVFESPVTPMVSTESITKDESNLESNKDVIAQKGNEYHPEIIPSPSQELKDITAAGVSVTEGSVSNQDDNMAMDIETDSYTGTVETSRPSVKPIDDISLSKQTSVRGARTPGASAPSAASNSNIANAEVAVIYDKSKSKKENVNSDPYSLYKKGDYAKALIMFDDLLNTNPSDLDAMFHKGMCLYHLKRYDAALTDLTNIRNKESKHSDEALFYIGQSYEQKGDTTSAISVYNIVVEGKGPFSTRASKRIKMLEGVR